MNDRSKKIESLLTQIVDEFLCSIQVYYRHGPDLTSRTDGEYFNVSVLLDREELLIEAERVLSEKD